MLGHRKHRSVVAYTLQMSTETVLSSLTDHYSTEQPGSGGVSVLDATTAVTSVPSLRYEALSLHISSVTILPSNPRILLIAYSTADARFFTLVGLEEMGVDELAGSSS